MLEKRKGKCVERKFTSAELTLLFYPSPNRIWISSCFISKAWVREHLSILIQANAECEIAASNRNYPLDKRVCSGISSLVSHSLSFFGFCRLWLSKMQEKCTKDKKTDFSSALLQHGSTPTFSLKLQSQWLYEETKPTCFCLAKCNMRASGWKPECVGVCQSACLYYILSIKILILLAK